MNNIKKDFPIFKNNKDIVYLDTTATAQKPSYVIE
jgi:selenocysteine lyase/cysteine desulfurase